MLEYEPWGNPSQMILANSDDVQPTAVSDHHGVEIFNGNNNNNNITAEHGGHHSALSLDYAHAHHHSTFNNNNTFSQHHHHHFFSSHQQTDHHTSNLHPLYDPRPFQTSYAPHNPFDTTGLNPNSASTAASAGYFLIPKAEDGVGRQVTRIGLNLGHRTYFSVQDDDFVTRLYRRSRPGGFEGVGSVNSPRCQAEGCAADLSNAKHYHRRHKVCQFHSKAATVVAGGLTQRFCQQCSRFHLLTEFDNGKRSCRKRLADHNRRRRKTPQQQSSSQSLLELQKSPVENSFNNLESPPDSSDGITHPSSSVTIVISPPRMTLECFGQRSYRDMGSSSSSSSAFYSN